MALSNHHWLFLSKNWRWYGRGSRNVKSAYRFRRKPAPKPPIGKATRQRPRVLTTIHNWAHTQFRRPYVREVNKPPAKSFIKQSGTNHPKQKKKITSRPQTSMQTPNSCHRLQWAIGRFTQLHHSVGDHTWKIVNLHEHCDGQLSKPGAAEPVCSMAQ